VAQRLADAVAAIDGAPALAPDAEAAVERQRGSTALTGMGQESTALIVIRTFERRRANSRVGAQV
jgi:hypothetical protein